MQIDQLLADIGFNLLDVDTFARGHPYDAYDRLRAEQPVLRHPGKGDLPPFWALFRHADIKALSLDGENFTSTKGFRIPTETRASMDPEISRVLGRFMLSMDNPEHAKFRNILRHAFTQPAIDKMAVKVTANVGKMIEELSGRETVEFVTDVGAMVPIKTACALLGLPESEEQRVFDYTNAVFMTDDPEFAPSIEVANERYMAIFDYARTMLNDRRKNPQDDLLTHIAHAEIDGEPITETEQISMFSNVLAAANETTRTTLSGCMIALDQFRDQRQRLIDDPDLLFSETVLNELMRWISPVYHMSRVAKKDTRIGDFDIREGEQVAMIYGAGNHDPEIYPDPRKLDFDRGNAIRHLAFGWGIHFCLGSRMALMQIPMILSTILKICPNYEIIGEPRYIPTNFVAAIKELNIRMN